VSEQSKRDSRSVGGKTKRETRSGEDRGASERARANERRNEDGVCDKLEVTRRDTTHAETLHIYIRGGKRGCAQKVPRIRREKKG